MKKILILAVMALSMSAFAQSVKLWDNALPQLVEMNYEFIEREPFTSRYEFEDPFLLFDSETGIVIFVNPQQQAVTYYIATNSKYYDVPDLAKKARAAYLFTDCLSETVTLFR